MDASVATYEEILDALIWDLDRAACGGTSDALGELLERDS